MRRRLRLALVAAGLTAAVPAVSMAALLWTLVITPLTTTVNQSTTFTLTATNLLLVDDLGCLEVDLPSSFVIESLGTPIASNGDTWTSSQSGNAVIVRSLTGGGRLNLGENVQFTIRAHSTLAGTFVWPNHAHRQQDCSTADQAGLPLTVTVLPALLSTPSPTPTPTPTPIPVATPAPTATPSPILPILPLPSIDLHLPTPSPTATPTARTTATPEPTTRPEPTTTPAASTGAGASGAGPLPGGGGASGGSTVAALQVGRGAGNGGADVELGTDLFGLLDVDVWLVPSAFVVGPGLLVILWVLLQTIGAVAWIPAVRRMADEEDARRHESKPSRA